MMTAVWLAATAVYTIATVVGWATAGASDSPGASAVACVLFALAAYACLAQAVGA